MWCSLAITGCLLALVHGQHLYYDDDELQASSEEVWAADSLKFPVNGSVVNDTELQAISEQVWAADSLRFPDNDSVVNTTGPTLFTFVNETRMDDTPIFQLFRDTFPHYEPFLGTPDNCTLNCTNAQNAFIDEMFNGNNRTMQLAHQFLVSKGLANSSVGAFKNEIRQYWFQAYSRSSRSVLDSSGFEHVFLGEVRRRRVIGFHNWVQAYYEEKGGAFKYGELNATCMPENLKFSFTWNNANKTANKTASSMWLRTTPEVEMALYTICFLARPNVSCNLTLDGNPQLLRAFPRRRVNLTTVDSVYPEC